LVDWDDEVVAVAVPEDGAHCSVVFGLGEIRFLLQPVPDVVRSEGLLLPCDDAKAAFCTELPVVVGIALNAIDVLLR
jgi:hypothetical protein